MIEKNKLFVIGSINIDLTIMCDKLPMKGETIEGSNFNIGLGGKGSNQAFYASELGTETILIGNIGFDFFGNYVSQMLALNKTVNRIVQKKQESTGVAMVVNFNNDNQIIINSGANKSFDDQNFIELENIKDGDFVLSQLEINEKFILKAFKECKLKKAITVLNAAPAVLKNNELYKYTDYLVLNEIECKTLLCLKELSFDFVELNQFLDYGVKNVILTLGEKGSFFVNKTIKIFQPPKIVKVKNTTGAGDSFIGAFIFKFLDTKDIYESLKFANDISAYICTRQETQVKNVLKELGE